MMHRMAQLDEKPQTGLSQGVRIVSPAPQYWCSSAGGADWTYTFSSFTSVS